MSAIKLMKPTLFLLVLLMVWMPQWVQAVPIDVSLDRTSVSLDESFQIIFTATDAPDGSPDFSPLEQDFLILNQSQSSNTVFVNGNLSKTVQWTLNVMAKKSGRLTIPAIKFGDDTSQSIMAVVNKNSNQKDVSHDNELFIDVKATPENPYVQSQVVYTMRLYRRVEITQAKLTEPSLNDAVVEKLGEDSEYNTLHNGINYRVTERKYVIFPQKSGQLVIDPLELTVDIIANSAPSINDFFNPQATKTKRILSKKIILNVKPAPDSFTSQHWLAAEQVELKQEWSGDIQKVKVGEPLTRTLDLQVKSTTVGQLPELNTAKSTEQLKIYPDQPVLQEQKTTEGLVASRIEKIALIPSQAGSYNLPAVEVPWFNTQSQKIQIAKLPAITITAIAVGDQAPVETVSPPPVVVSEPALKEKARDVVDKTAVKLESVLWQNNLWLWVVCIFLAVGWLGTLIYFFVKKNAAKKPVLVQEEDADIKACIKRLKKACSQNDVLAAKEALLDWGLKQFGATSLGAIATCCEARLRDEILLLNQILYGRENGESANKPMAAWDGKKMFQYFIENKARKAIANKDNSLEPLYRL